MPAVPSEQSLSRHRPLRQSGSGQNRVGEGLQPGGLILIAKGVIKLSSNIPIKLTCRQQQAFIHIIIARINVLEH